MCSIELKSWLQVDLFLEQNTDNRSKSIFKFMYYRVFGSIQIKIQNIVKTRLYFLSSSF